MIGRMIRQRREELGLSQEDLAKRIGVGKTAISNYEVNVSSPREPILIALFDALQCDANYLYSDYIKNSGNIASQKPNTYITASDKELLKHFHKLSEHGKKIAIERMEEMTELPQYTT